MPIDSSEYLPSFNVLTESPQNEKESVKPYLVSAMKSQNSHVKRNPLKMSNNKNLMQEKQVSFNDLKYNYESDLLLNRRYSSPDYKTRNSEYINIQQYESPQNVNNKQKSNSYYRKSNYTISDLERDNYMKSSKNDRYFNTFSTNSQTKFTDRYARLTKDPRKENRSLNKTQNAVLRYKSGAKYRIQPKLNSIQTRQEISTNLNKNFKVTPN